MAERVRAAAKLRNEDSRNHRRMELFSKVRGVDDERQKVISVDDVNYALSTLEDNIQESLAVLKKAFVQDPAHVVTFLRHKSALHFVVGRLISSDPYEQLEALECCCNATLGDSKSCSLVARAGAVYMIQLVYGTNLNLIKVALTTLGNLSMSGINTCKLLHEQGVCSALLAALKVDETRDLAAKALCQFTYVYLPCLEDNEVLETLDAALPHFDRLPEVQWLVAQLSAHDSARVRLSSLDVSSGAVNKLLVLDDISADNLRSVTALMRLLGNLGGPLTDIRVLRKFERLVSNCDYPHVRKELPWLLSSLQKAPSVIEMDT